jgi:hypothetical protein
LTFGLSQKNWQTGAQPSPLGFTSSSLVAYCGLDL